MFRCLQPHVEENLRTRPTRPRLAHLPEVVLQPVLKDALLRHAHFHPVTLGLIVPRNPIGRVALKDRHVQLVLVDPVPLRAGHQFPRKPDRLALEVVAKAEVAQHLKEGVVPPCKPHIFQVVMLPARPHAFLARRGAHVVALLRAQKKVFELVHARIGKQQRRVVGRHQRRGVHPAVPLRLKKAQKKFAYLVPRAVLHGPSSVIGIGVYTHPRQSPTT